MVLLWYLELLLPMKTVKYPQPITKAWFFCPNSCALFVGISGSTYPDSYELEEVPDWLSMGGERLRLYGEDMVMKWINPYTVQHGGTLDLKTGITIYYKEIW